MKFYGARDNTIGANVRGAASHKEVRQYDMEGWSAG